MSPAPHGGRKTLILARDPGAAGALAPVARRCASIIVGLEHARSVFHAAGLPMEVLSADDDAGTAARVLAALRPDVLLTGTSRREAAPRDALWWVAARDAGIPSVALLDHWIGYAQKFITTTPFDSTPDVIAVMDAYARDQLREAGCRDARLVVTGHPAFDALMTADVAGRATARERWHARANAPVLLFASEPIASDVGALRGYDETDALALLLRALGDAPFQLVIRPHPREHPASLQRVLDEHGRAARVEVTLSGREAVAGADLVVGMTSVLLLEAAVTGRPVLSIQPGAREPWTDHFQTLVTTVESVESARAWLQDPGNHAVLEREPRHARIRAAGFDERGTATDNVCRLLGELSLPLSS